LLALAAGVKLFALVIAPFLLLWHLRGWLTFVATALISALPFGVLNAWVPVGLKAMGNDWVFNAPIYLAARTWLDAAQVAALKLVLLALFVAIWLLMLWRWSQRCWYRGHLPLPELPLFWLFGLFLAILPVQNPWYLVWWLPFAVLRPIVTPWVASAAILLSYVSGINLAGNLMGIQLGLYEQPTWVLATEFTLIAIAIYYDYRRLNFPASRA
jgi:hypothetical protein